jgi:hypothetical protein
MAYKIRMSGLSEGEKLARELESLLDELTPEKIAEMDYDEIIDIRKKLNPYGRTIEGSDNWLTFSFTNLAEKYMERLLLTGLIGFLNRACDEWHVPDGIPVIPVYDFVRDPESITRFASDWKMTDKIQKDVRSNAEWMRKRVVVKEFLEDMFQYNPDQHVRSSYKPQPKDIERMIVTTPAAQLSIEEWRKRDPKFREQMLEFDRVQHLRAMKETQDEKVDAIIDDLVSRNLVLPDQHYSTMDFAKWSEEDKNLLRTVCDMIPPADIYKKFRTYFENNYDKLREAVLHLYCDKPDFDIAVNPYQWHDSEESAIDFQKKHRDEVIADIIKVASGKWNFFAPFERVQSTAKFFNKNTIVLEEMAEQIERDQKLGADMMRKKVSVKKRQNIAEDGPDAEAFNKWKAQNTVLKDKGAESFNKESYAPADTPDDAICVPVFRISQGGLKMEKDHFFTKAEAPNVSQSED